MNVFNPILIAILIFGFHTSYTDIKYGKIKNVSILLLLITSVLINVLFTKTLSSIDFSLNSDFIQTLTNVIITFIFGFFLWSSGLWSEGDAKLFLGYSLLLPVFTYKYGYVSFFPSLVILVNTFIPIAIFYIFDSFRQTKFNVLKTNIKEIFSLKQILNLFFVVFGLFYILDLFLLQFQISLNIFVKLLIMFALMEILNKISNATLIISLLGSLLRIILSFNSIFTYTFLNEFLFSVPFFLVLRLIINITEFSVVVKINDLRSGMMLTEQLVHTKKGIEKKELSLLTFFDILGSVKESLIGDVKVRLTKDDIKVLKMLKKKGKLEFDEIKIAKTVPFAPFMLFGVLLTYFLQGSLFYYLHIFG
jgi:Flp pilus assembly protein protease CpaA